MDSIRESIEKTEKARASLFKELKHLEQKLESTKRKYAAASQKLQELKKSQCEAQNRYQIATAASTLEADWIERDFAWSARLHKKLRDKFHFTTFRPKQLAAINATLAKRDVLLVMPTGGGKSLVYQLPALLGTGFTLVVSPLLSLIQDQLFALERLGIKAVSVNSGMPRRDVASAYDLMARGTNLKLVYVTPEWMAKSKRFMGRLKKCYDDGIVDRVAIDEVHCCSTWGHDFRPEYKYLGILRPILANVPFIGLTATATMSVLTDIQTILTMDNCMIITAPFNRPNLYYKVVSKPASRSDVVDSLEMYLSKHYANQSGIIYTTTVSDCTNLASELRARNLKVAPYHAQLDAEQKETIHTKWLNKTYQAVVATMAFGMGIDKPDVRFVIHHSVPKSMENLYQESGRAGRDSQRADCIVLYSINDYLRIVSMAASVNDEENALDVLEYCLDQVSCRRSLIATHFEETWDASDCNKMCDHCDRGEDALSSVYYDISGYCRDLHALIDNAATLDEKLTVNKLVDCWFQTSSKKLRISTLVKPKLTKQQAEYVISYLLFYRYLEIEKGYNMYSTICYIRKGKRDIGEVIEMLTCQRFLGLSKRYDDHRYCAEVVPPRKKIKT